MRGKSPTLRGESELEDPENVVKGVMVGNAARTRTPGALAPLGGSGSGISMLVAAMRKTDWESAPVFNLAMARMVLPQGF